MMDPLLQTVIMVLLGLVLGACLHIVKLIKPTKWHLLFYFLFSPIGLLTMIFIRTVLFGPAIMYSTYFNDVISFHSIQRFINYQPNFLWNILFDVNWLVMYFIVFGLFFVLAPGVVYIVMTDDVHDKIEQVSE